VLYTLAILIVLGKGHCTKEVRRHSWNTELGWLHNAVKIHAQLGLPLQLAAFWGFHRRPHHFYLNLCSWILESRPAWRSFFVPSICSQTPQISISSNMYPAAFSSPWRPFVHWPTEARESSTQFLMSSYYCGLQHFLAGLQPLWPTLVFSLLGCPSRPYYHLWPCTEWPEVPIWQMGPSENSSQSSIQSHSWHQSLRITD
jgi:hypothetical protein